MQAKNAVLHSAAVKKTCFGFPVSLNDVHLARLLFGFGGDVIADGFYSSGVIEHFKACLDGRIFAIDRSIAKRPGMMLDFGLRSLAKKNMSRAVDAFDLNFERRERYLYASLACRTLTPSIALEILGEVMSQAADQRCKRVMVQCDLASIERDSHLLEAMLALATMRSGTRVAFVDCRDSSHEHPAIGDDFKLFDDSKEAEEWLLAKGPDPLEVEA